MVRRIKDFIRYTTSELENYTKRTDSCIKKINKTVHINFPPYGLATFKATLRKIIAEKHIGAFDTELNGIVLDLRNVKVLGDLGAIRFDDPTIHIDIQADCYIFKPKIGSIVQGLVKHVSQRQIGVIIYRVFSVPIRLPECVDKSSIDMNSEIEFRITKFDLQNAMPYIEGELMAKEVTRIKLENKQIIEVDSEESSSNDEEDYFAGRDTSKSQNNLSDEDESKNDDVVFSNLCYLNDEDVKQIKIPGRKKNQGLNKNNSNNEANKAVEPILKKRVKFTNSDSSSESSDTEKPTPKTVRPSVVSKNQNFNNNHETSESSEDEPKISKNLKNELNLNKRTANGSDDNHNSKIKKDFNSDSSSSNSNEDEKFIKEKNMSKVKASKEKRRKDSSSESSDGDRNKEKTINVEKKDISAVKMSDRNRKFSGSSESTEDDDVHKKTEHHRPLEKIKIESSALIQRTESSVFSDNSNVAETPIKNTHINVIKTEIMSPNEGWKVASPSQKNNINIKTELFSPIKQNCNLEIDLNDIKTEITIGQNGYESEDLFDQASVSQVPPNQPLSKNKNSPKKLNGLNRMMEDNLRRKQQKLTDFMPAHSTLEVKNGEPKASEDRSDSSFSNAFQEILNKTKQEKLLQSSQSSNCSDSKSSQSELINNNGQTKVTTKKKASKKIDLNQSMAAILERAKAQKLKQHKQSEGAKSDGQTKARKRKISLNDSMNDILTKIKMQKKQKLN